MNKKVIIGCLSVFLAGKTFGGIGDDLLTFFEKSGVMSNVTTPGALL